MRWDSAPFGGLVAVLVLLAFGLSGCGSRGTTTTAQSRTPAQPTTINVVFGVAPVGSSEPTPSEDDPVWAARVASASAVESGTLNAVLRVESGIPKGEFRLLSFVDLRQEPFDVGSRSVNHFDFTVDNGKARSDRLRSARSSQEVHEATWLLIWEPIPWPGKEIDRLSTGNSFFSGRRILFGEDDSRTAAARPVVPVQTREATAGLDGIVVNGFATKPLENQLSIEASRGAVVRLWAHVGNDDQSASRYALIALLDFQQVTLGGPLGSGGVVSVPSGHTAVVPFSILAPTTPGEYEFMIVGVKNPGELPKSKDSSSDNGIRTSVRANLRVR